MSEMRLSRKEDLSLMMYIKNVALASFIERETNIDLLYVPDISVEAGVTPSLVYEASTTMLPSPTERGRGWVYFDDEPFNPFGKGPYCPPEDPTASGVYVDGTRPDGVTVSGAVPEQSSRVTVYPLIDEDVVDYDNPIDPSEYMIDYLDGRIVTSGTVTPGAVDYDWHYVSVVDEWAAIEASDPPVVVIDLVETEKAGYQLGAGKRVKRKVDLHIFASDTAERNDLTETLYDALYLRSCPLYDFPTGSVLDYDGTWHGRRDDPNKLTSLFDRRVALDPNTGEPVILGNLEFEKVVARNINLPLLISRGRNEVMLSDLNAYRAKISFELISYTRT
jgi:hypothetical protein